MGFGLDIPTSSGITHADASAGACSADGDPRAVAQMLTDLGFYHGTVAATLNSADSLALALAVLTYAKSKSVDTTTTSPLLICQMLISDWQTKKASDTTKTVLIVFGILGLGAAIYVATKSRRW